ncbi:MAG: hypothetical protein WCA38_15520 [Candidatus Acidiferrales bacterium]
MIGPRSLLLVMILTFAAAGLASASATNVYTTPNGTATGNCPAGTSAAPNLTFAQFNSSSSWGSGTSQIGPGTTVLACTGGLYTAPTNTALLVFQGSGSGPSSTTATCSSPITLIMDSNVTFAENAFPFGGAIETNGNSCLVIDGGSGRATIENLANGTPGASGCLNGSCSVQQDSRFVYLSSPSSNITVQNLTLVDPYVIQNAGSDSFPADDGEEGIFFASGRNNVTINNNLCHDAVICFDGWGSYEQISNNEAYNCNRCVTIGPSVISNVNIFGNKIHDFEKWDGNSAYHHDGVHIFPNGGSDNASNISIYNNYFYGPGTCCGTAFLYLEGSFSGAMQLFNNLFNFGTLTNVGVIGGYDGGANSTLSGAVIANNTCIGAVVNANLCYEFNQWLNMTFENNIATGNGGLGSYEGGSTFSTLNKNAWEDICTDYGFCNMWGYGGTDIVSFPAWQSATGGDANAVFNTLSNLKVSTTTGVLSSGSPLIGAGANLTSLGIAALNTGAPETFGQDGACGTGCVQRASSGAWDIGAYPYSSAGPTVTPAPALGMFAWDWNEDVYEFGR